MNEETGRVISRRGWKGESLVIPLGVDPARFKKIDAGALRERIGLNWFTIGFAGKLDAQKNPLGLIRAAAGLGDDFNLLIIGEGPLRKDCHRLAAELGIGEKTFFPGPVPHERMPEYLNCLDCLVMPSLTRKNLKEQFGRVLIEAMSCAVPVVGSDSGEIPAVIGESGLVLPEGDTTALRAALSRLRDDPSLINRLGEEGRRRAEEKYSWAAVARCQIGVYRRLLGEAS